MWPFSDEEEQLDENTLDFKEVAQGIFEQAETQEAGLLALQDAFNSYEFEDPSKALEIFGDSSSQVRKKFGDTKPFDFQTTLSLAPKDFTEFTSDLEDPDENRIDIINKWETENLRALAEEDDLNYIQLRPQLERSIKQIATIQRREVYGSDNYLVTDQALRIAQGAVGPIASLVGLDSVNDWFTENTDPDGASVFGYEIGGDDSYWSAISSGLGSVGGAVGAGVATGGPWGTVGYLGASGAGSVRARVEDALENEATAGEALAAGAIETVSQVGQVAVGTKVFGSAVNRILGRSSSALGEKVFPKVLKAGALEGSTEAAGQVVSNVGQNVGRGDDLDTDLLEGVDKSFVAGFVGGGVATGTAELVGPDTSSKFKDIDSINKSFTDYENSDVEFIRQDKQVINPEYLKETESELNTDIERYREKLDEARTKLKNATSEASKEKWSEKVQLLEKNLSQFETSLSNISKDRAELLPLKSSSTGNIYSKQLSPELMQAVDYWTAGFGIDNLHILTPEDIKNEAFAGVIPTRDLSGLSQHARENTFSGFSTTIYSGDGTNKHYIVTKDPGNSYQAHHILSHEIGHILTNQKLIYPRPQGAASLNEERFKLLNSLKDEYTSYKKELGHNVSDLSEGLQGPLGNFIKSEKTVSQLNPAAFEYLVGEDGFHEFIANRVTEYALNPKKKPSTIAGQFFKDLADTFRELWGKLNGKFKQSPTLEKWLDEQFKSDKALSALSNFQNFYSTPTDPLLEIEGEAPPPQEVVSAKMVSTDLFEPGVTRAKLQDGSEIVEADGSFHLMKEGKVLQAYDAMKPVKPEIAQKLRQLVADGNPDGTAVTVTTDGTNLLVESEFIDDSLNMTSQKTGKQRVVVPIEPTEQGSVPVFASKTRTTDGVRQNPFFIAPAPVTEGTLSAAKAGYNQYLSPYMQRVMDELGPELSEELGLSVESFETLPSGETVGTQVPLQTKFGFTHAETGQDAVEFIRQRGILGSLDYLNNTDKFNKTDAGVANIVVHKLQSAFSQLQRKFAETGSVKDIERLATVGDLFSHAIILKDKVSSVFGGGLGSLTNTADTIHNARAKGEFRLAQLEAELTKQAYHKYEKQTGEAVNIQQWAEEAKAAQQELKQAEAEGKPAEEGAPVSKEAQEKITKAKERYNKAVEKITKAEELRQEQLSELTPEAKTNLVDMYEMLGKLNGELQLKYAQKVFDREVELGLKDITPDRFDQIYNFFRSNLLSGPSTQLRNLLGNTSKAVSDIVGLIGSGQFKEAGIFMEQWLGTFGTSGKEFLEIVEGNRAGRFKFDVTATDSKGNVKNIDKVPSLKNPLTAIQNAMYRLLTAQDAVFYRNSNSAMAYLAEHIAHKHIKDPKERTAYIEKALGWDQKQSIEEQVQKEADLLKEAGIEVSDREKALDVAYRMERLRSERTSQIANKYGERSVFVNDPGGILGAFYDGLEKVADKISVPVGDTVVKPLKFFLPFTRVASNVTSHLMEFTPVGILKGALNNPDKTNAISHGLSEIEARMVLGRGLVGTSLIAGFFAFADAFKDDDDPYIAFYGYPPKGKWKEWQARGIPLFSMKWGDSIIPLQGTSLAAIPAIVGGGIEQLKAGASYDDVIKAASVASMGVVANMSFLKPAGELFDYFMGAKEYGSPGEPESGTAAKRKWNFLKTEADLIVSGFIPASGFFNNLGRWMNESPVETYNNLTAKVLGEMPFGRATALGPQLNMFGEPITKPLIERFSAGLAPHTIKTDPVFLWMQETGFSIPDQGPILTMTRKAEKQAFGEVNKNITGYANILDEEQSRRVLQISGPRIKEFLNSIRKNPAFQVKNERAQKFINERINDIRAEARFQVLSNP